MTDYGAVADQKGDTAGGPSKGLERVGKMLLGTAVLLCITLGSFLVLYSWFRPVRTGCEVEISFSNSCTAVQKEIDARVLLTSWHDPQPDNNGTYRYTKKLAMHYQLQRDSVSSSKINYTDVIDLKFTAPTDQVLIIGSSSPSLTRIERKTCHIKASSWSKDVSLLHHGSSFCNIYNLFCQTKLIYTYKVGKCSQYDVQKCSSRASV